MSEDRSAVVVGWTCTSRRCGWRRCVMVSCCARRRLAMTTSSCSWSGLGRPEAAPIAFMHPTSPARSSSSSARSLLRGRGSHDHYRQRNQQPDGPKNHSSGCEAATRETARGSVDLALGVYA